MCLLPFYIDFYFTVLPPPNVRKLCSLYSVSTPNLLYSAYFYTVFIKFDFLSVLTVSLWARSSVLKMQLQQRTPAERQFASYHYELGTIFKG